MTGLRIAGSQRGGASQVGGRREGCLRIEKAWYALNSPFCAQNGGFKPKKRSFSSMDRNFINQLRRFDPVTTEVRPRHRSPRFRALCRTKYFSNSTKNNTDEETSRMRNQISESIAVVPNKD